MQVVPTKILDIGGFVIGGSSDDSTADFNAVRIGSNAIVKKFVTGGSAGSDNQAVRDNVSASSNSVHIGDSSEIFGGVTGGSGGKTASFNEVYIGNGVKVGREVHLVNGESITGGTTSLEADFMSTEANSNVVHIGDDVASTSVIGASANEPFSKNNTVNENRVTIGNRSNTLMIVGGWSSEASTVMKNEVTVGTDAKAGEIYGGLTASGDASNNTVRVGKNLVANFVSGGETTSGVHGEGNAHHNTVVIGENAVIKQRVVGGQALTNANNNTVILLKGFKVDSVGGGIALNDTMNNTVTLFAGTVTHNIVGGNSNNFKGNTLNLGSPAEGIEMNKLSAAEVKNFETINFYLPQNVRHQDVVLQLTKMYPESLGDTVINAYVPGNADLKSGDVVHLVRADDGGWLGWNGKGNVYQGVTLIHNLADIALDENQQSIDLTFKRSNKQTASTPPATTKPVTTTPPATTKPVTTTPPATTKPVATTPPATTTPTVVTPPATTTPTVVTPPATTTPTVVTPPATTTPTVATPAATPSAPATTVNPKTKSLAQGRLVAPALINGGADYLASGLDALYQSTNVRASGANGHAFVSTRADNREVTTGSHVDLKGVALDVGYAWNRPLGSGNLMYGVAAEYGTSRYKSYLDDGTKGKGQAWNLGVNLFTNYLWANGLYTQGSVRAGRVSSDYRSNDFVHAEGNSVSYDSKSNYIAAHAGLGKIWKLGSANQLDTYVKYFHSYTSGDKVKLSSGETYDFDSVQSKRGRVGAQYSHHLGKLGVHFGMAYEREWGGDVRGQYQGHALPTPTMKGGKTIGEAGMYYSLRDDKQVYTTLQGFGGRQQGVGVRFGMKF